MFKKEKNEIYHSVIHSLTGFTKDQKVTHGLCQTGYKFGIMISVSLSPGTSENRNIQSKRTEMHPSIQKEDHIHERR